MLTLALFQTEYGARTVAFRNLDGIGYAVATRGAVRVYNRASANEAIVVSSSPTGVAGSKEYDGQGRSRDHGHYAGYGTGLRGPTPNLCSVRRYGGLRDRVAILLHDMARWCAQKAEGMQNAHNLRVPVRSALGLFPSRLLAARNGSKGGRVLVRLQ